ncbi:hypothetical protein MSG28_007941 [Choristoneura fumiferana]|uniref:Uncharacterized protein n=1 Tax=Choristoneura fumiferana TaxID=7141 RepID=A0ACC0J9B1_CHOFU|nr:hypothetical protein MSG28_007941 [Choristoneura fumiferana]
MVLSMVATTQIEVSRNVRFMAVSLQSVTGGVRALAPQLFQLSHLTALYLNDNSLQRIPPDINMLRATPPQQLPQGPALRVGQAVPPPETWSPRQSA